MNNYELIWESFMTDQITAKQLDNYIRQDAEFETFVWNKIREHNDEAIDE